MKSKYFLLISIPIILLFFACILSFLYFYTLPVYTSWQKVIHLHSLNLDSARNYYTVLSSTITFFVGVIGLILGYFYYRNKHKIDSIVSEIERKRKRLSDLLSNINSFDELVDTIIHGRYSDSKELKHLRSRISRSFESIEIMLELNNVLLGLNDEDVRTILKVNSYVDKNDILMHLDHKTLNESALLSIKDTYIDLIQAARRACYRRVC